MKLTALPILLLFVITSLGVSCKKKDKKPDNSTVANETCDTTFINNYINDTIFPSDYLMTYPGSEWNYDNGTTVTCDAWENIAFTSTTSNDNCDTVTKSYHFLPLCNSSPYYIAYNKEIDIANPFNTKSIPLVDTTVGVFHQNNYTIVGWQSPYHITHINETYSVEEKLNSLEVLSVTYNDVIHVRRYVVGTGHSPGTATYHYYYAKNVGLIKSYTGEFTVQNEKKLVSYTIGPH